MTWLNFREVKDTGKTKIWAITNSQNGSYLGTVRWSGPWRQYIYHTDDQNVIWNNSCMGELIAFIQARMDERKVVANGN